GVYAVLAECGFFPVKDLARHCQDGSALSGHVSHKDIPGVELSTGSLGHGLSVGTGMAYAAALDGKKHRVVVLLSDGECDEGSNWEAILFAAHHKLERLLVIVDYNKIQSLKPVSETLELEHVADKSRSVGWRAAGADGGCRSSRLFHHVRSRLRRRRPIRRKVSASVPERRRRRTEHDRPGDRLGPRRTRRLHVFDRQFSHAAVPRAGS